MITGFLGHRFSIYPDRFGRYGCQDCEFKIWLIYTHGLKTGQPHMLIGYRVPVTCPSGVAR